jgi:hypothetical protein
VRDVFAAVNPSVNDENFLKVFQASGCYLVDLCSQPVDRMAAPLRRTTCRASEHSLALTIGRLRPQMITTMLRSIEGNVSNAVAQASWSGPLLHLPYPGRWAHLKSEFVTGLLPVIECLLRVEEPLERPQRIRDCASPSPSRKGAELNSMGRGCHGLRPDEH